MKISIPTRKRKLNDDKCASKALAVYLGKKRLTFGDKNWGLYDINVSDDYTYYPYWVGIIYTIKDRALAIYPPKEITYYLVCDAIDESFIVLRNVPSLRQINCDEDNVVPAQVSKEKLLNEISNEAIKDRINRQFIFGPPKAKIMSASKIFLPLKKVEIKKKNSSEGRVYGVNVFTGEVKKFGKVNL